MTGTGTQTQMQTTGVTTIALLVLRTGELKSEKSKDYFCYFCTNTYLRVFTGITFIKMYQLHQKRHFFLPKRIGIFLISPQNICCGYSKCSTEALLVPTAYVFVIKKNITWSYDVSLSHCRLNRLSHTIYWKSPISILGTSGYEIYIFLEKNGKTICKQWKP